MRRLAALLLWLPLFCSAGELPPAAAKKIDFAADIMPLFKTHCLSCHGPQKQKGGLRLDMKHTAIRAGDKDSPILAGESAKSPLIQAVAGLDEDLVMPPEGERLSAAQVGLLRAWIDQGAIWPDEHSVKVDDGSAHWSVQPVKRPALPQIKNDNWPRNEIDRFILAPLEAKGLAPSAEAGRRALIRRLSYDLLGLPPTPERAAAFSNDPDPNAYEKLVDELLASPHYGERWARHWLDIAHYADTHGFERDMRRDHAWRYRDYVIAAFNADKPYDKFLTEQIAGDVLWPDDPAAVVATGFLAAGPYDYVGQAETPNLVLRRQARADDLDDIVNQVMSASVAMTVNCARCHDHKLDPILQREYYSLAAVFAGIRRDNRPVSLTQQRTYQEQIAALNTAKDEVNREIARLTGAINLADIVGGGNGFGTGKKGHGIDASNGKVLAQQQDNVREIKPNEYVRGPYPFVDGVAIPNGGDGREVPVSSTGLKIKDAPATSAQAWDGVRYGPVKFQEHTRIGNVDYASAGHSVLALHANALVTFDLAAIREASGAGALRFTAMLGLGSAHDVGSADLRVYVDGVLQVQHLNVTKKTAPISLGIELPVTARFLTLLSTDAGNGIAHDQLFFGDPVLQPLKPAASEADNRARIEQAHVRLAELDKQLKALPQPDKFFGVLSETPPPVHLLRRGNTEDPGPAVPPATIAWTKALPPEIGDEKMPEGARRAALAKWVADPRNPLTRRVIVNRLWQHHFGQGLVTTPSDFGRGGDKPSHPELLDWLAEELLTRGWSLKAIHKLIVTSATYRQASRMNDAAAAVDAQNRLLWRYAPRRADAEALRDFVLAASGALNPQAGGPGYQDFIYKEEYAPVYSYVAPKTPELLRRSIYRFVVRTTPHPFLSTFDCPNFAGLTPKRVVTTTALQALALSNNEFMLLQAKHFAERVARDAGADLSAQLARAFALAYCRPPAEKELEAARKLAATHGLFAVCRMLLNSNEFIYLE